LLLTVDSHLEQHGGGHLDLGKRLERTFLILFIPVLCCIRYQVWWERKGNWLMLMCVLPLIIAEVYLLKFA